MKRLAEQTHQELYDNALNGIRDQGYRRSSAAHAGRCLYRGPNGLKCAVGHSLSDAEYHPDMESMWFEEVCENLGVDDDTMEFLAELQNIHDLQLKFDRFETAMRELAELEGLTYTPPSAEGGEA